MSTYEPIASQTLGSAAASVTFSSIPQGYTDLVVVCSAKNSSASAGRGMRLEFNADSASNYSSTYISGDGTSATSARYTSTTYLDIVTTISETDFSPVICNLQNYSNGTTYKTVLTRGASNINTRASVGLWRSTSAITSVKISMSADNFVSGSTFSLYGIQVGDKVQKAQGGNIVTSDGTYVYHTFTSSGAFIPSQALTVDYLVVAGGGGGGSESESGGGGAGGLRSTVTATGGGGSLESALSLSSNKSYPVIVGAGGVANTNGNNSVFSTITSTGGGRGRSIINPSDTGNGGSGGGGYGVTSYTAGGTGTTNQGYAGGTAAAVVMNRAGGAGGGAGAVGGNGTGSSGGIGGTGGTGIAVSISGSSITYAGGGGGGAQSGTGGSGGSGGGGTGANASGVATGGTINTGGGGGGGGTAGAGGSGIVIIRYLA